MNDFWLQFEAILATRTGLQIRAQDRAFVEKTLTARAQQHQKSAANYLDLLQSADSASEWNYLFGVLTNQESYFFRDTGQFELLRDEILPALMARNHERRALKLWSAGCSTGEEPYSLAMTLDGLLPFRDGWNVQIVATDLSETALHKAQNGVYGAWSFRNTPDAMRDRYFQKRGKEWVFDRRLRQMVSFRHGNLRDDDFALGGLNDFDLILCRNVFIYFRREAVAHVAQKFRDALRLHAYLLTGHAELHDVDLPDLTARTFKPSVIYQRTSSTRCAPHTAETAFQTAIFDRANALSHQITPSQPMQTRRAPELAPELAPEIARETVPMRTFNVASKPATPTDERKTDERKTDEPATDEMCVVQRAAAMLRAGRSHDALALLQPLLRDDASSNAFDQTPDVAARFGACCLAAQYHANNAQHEAAWHLCQRALALDALAPLPYHIQARIEDERGNGEHAKELLKKVIYLAPQSPVAMMELAAIYRREGDTQRARCWHDSALQALIEYSNNDELALPQWSLDATQHAGSLRAHCENAVRENALFNSVATEVIVQKFSGM